jgi:hypothetical protein
VSARARLVACAALAACSSRPSSPVDAGASANTATACIVVEVCALDFNGVSPCTATIAGVNLPARALQAHVDAEQVDCLAAAGADCDAARACLNGGKMPQTCTQFLASSCAGSELVTCTISTGTQGMLGTAEFDCTSGAASCVPLDGGASCGAGACSGTAASCRDDLVETCDQGVLHDLDCAALGARCVALGGAPRCRGTGATCSSSALNTGKPLRCEGTVLVSCWDGQEARFDCAQMGAGCFPTVTGGSFGCALGAACDPRSFTESCAGSKLTLCDDGQIAIIDCAAIGFQSCRTNNCSLLP